jgi:hypothetical protein
MPTIKKIPPSLSLDYSYKAPEGIVKISGSRFPKNKLFKFEVEITSFKTRTTKLEAIYAVKSDSIGHLSSNCYMYSAVNDLPGWITVIVSEGGKLIAMASIIA